MSWGEEQIKHHSSWSAGWLTERLQALSWFRIIRFVKVCTTIKLLWNCRKKKTQKLIFSCHFPENWLVREAWFCSMLDLWCSPVTRKRTVMARSCCVDRSLVPPHWSEWGDRGGHCVSLTRQQTYFHILSAYLIIHARFWLIQSYLKDFMWKYGALLEIKAL